MDGKKGTKEHDDVRSYNWNVQTYAGPENIDRVPTCFAIMVTNIGDTIAFVNGAIIHPNSAPATGLGDSRSFSGHKNDLYKGNLVLKFDTIAPGTNPLVEVIQFFYAD